MNKLPLIALTASLSIGLIGCSSEEEETVAPFDWTISESNAKNVVGQILSYEDGEGNATGTISSDTNSDLKANNTQKFFNGTFPCEKSGSLTSAYNSTDFDNFSWTLSFSSCNNNDGAGPVDGSMSIASSSDSVSGDITGMIDLNLTSQGFTITGDIDSTTYGADSSIETSFSLAISATVGGSLTAQTGTNFVTYSGDLYPSVGDMTVTGPLNNSIIITAVDNTYVQIQVDLGSDGNIESDETVLWSSL